MMSSWFYSNRSRLYLYFIYIYLFKLSLNINANDIFDTFTSSTYERDNGTFEYIILQISSNKLAAGVGTQQKQN